MGPYIWPATDVRSNWVHTYFISNTIHSFEGFDYFFTDTQTTQALCLEEGLWKVHVKSMSNRYFNRKITKGIIMRR